MPVYSMTGYASAQHSSTKAGSDSDAPSPGGAQLGLEIRAVNSRFLDLSFRLPEDLRQHETAMRELLTAKLKRGKIEVRAFSNDNASASINEPTPKQLQRLNALQDNVRVWLPDAGALSVADVVRLAQSDQGLNRDWSGIILPLAERALKDLLSARQREGERLAQMLRGHTDQLRLLANKVVPLVPELVVQQRQRFLERWNEALALGESNISTQMAQERALTEATAFAIRIDVAEEVTRLSSHLDEIERLVKKGGEIGKRLDFLIQELHREANTMGSKSAALELTHISVDMKVLIEQMREQVQNIE